jgi:hypothetical protein
MLQYNILKTACASTVKAGRGSYIKHIGGANTTYHHVSAVFCIKLLSGGKMLLLIHTVVQNQNKKRWQKINGKSSSYKKIK